MAPLSYMTVSPVTRFVPTLPSQRSYVPGMAKGDCRQLEVEDAVDDICALETESFFVFQIWSILLHIRVNDWPIRRPKKTDQLSCHPVFSGFRG